jgi:hypothetical protein
MYTTEFHLDIHSGNEQLFERLIKECYHAYEALELQEDVSWIDHEEDLLAFSSRFPDEVFELTGYGQQPTDIWKKYFQNGKFYCCPATITFEEFDSLKLKQ